MENLSGYPEHIYLKKDIDKAFLMGLELAIYILEHSMCLSRAGQQYMLDSLKETIVQGKIFNIISN